MYFGIFGISMYLYMRIQLAGYVFISFDSQFSIKGTGPG